METPIDNLIKQADKAVTHLKQVMIAQIIYVRIMGIGIVKTGMQIEDTKYWPVKKGDSVRGYRIIPEDGVFIEYGDRTTQYIPNSAYKNKSFCEPIPC